jgi:acyl carrier protein
MSSSMNNIEGTLIEYIRVNILKRPKFELGLDDPIISTGLIDSFHLVDLSVFIEEQFGVRIDDTELTAETFDSVTQLADLIKNKQ